MNYRTVVFPSPPTCCAIGTKFLTRGKHKKVCTVVDIYDTYNAAGVHVKRRYVATHELLGQTITDYDVPETTILIGMRELERELGTSVSK